VKERLTGAIILVALIVLLVPELLTGPPRTKTAGAPPAGTTVAAAPVQSYTLPLGPGARAAAQRLTAPAAGSPGAATPPSATHASSAQPSAAPTPVPAAHPAPPPEIRSEAKPKVQAHAQPQVQPSVRPRVTPRRTAPVHRPVRSVPLRHPRHPAARTARRAPTGGHWTVQLGVFAVHADALRLAGRVRAKGFGVHLTPLRIRGRLLWRVTAQTEPTRAAALQLARRLGRAGLRGDLLRQ
jgi:cell division septation protein DedD